MGRPRGPRSSRGRRFTGYAPHHTHLDVFVLVGLVELDEGSKAKTSIRFSMIFPDDLLDMLRAPELVASGRVALHELKGFLDAELA